MTTQDLKRAENERLAGWKRDILRELAEVKARAAALEERLNTYREYARGLEDTVARLKGFETRGEAKP
jgi:hypothetical protein